MQDSNKPVIPAKTLLPELSVKAVIIGIILAVILGSANAYLALKVGITISACIPAAVMSMGILRFFRHSNILENNIIQTMASAGESVACGAAFALPALVLMRYWTNFNPWQTFFVTLIGCILGVALSIPLRRTFIVKQKLEYPEGVATAEILKAGHNKKDDPKGLLVLIYGGLISGIFQFLQAGFQMIPSTLHYWVRGAGTVFGFSLDFSPATLAAGYVVGIKSSFSLVVGSILCWFFMVPMYGFLYGLPHENTMTSAMMIWNDHIRMVGIGAMFVGGLWTVYSLLEPLKISAQSSWEAYKDRNISVLRTDYDVPFPLVMVSVILCLMGAAFFIYKVFFLNATLSLFAIAAFVIFIMILLAVVAFLCAPLSGYTVGVFGSSNMPLSGILLIAVLSFSLFFWGFLNIFFSVNSAMALQAAGIVILMTTIIAVTSAFCGDNLQDYKSGYVVGATPWKQQVSLLIGGVVTACFTAPLIEFLFQAYGLGDVLPRAGMDPSQALAAPKAAILSMLSLSIFSQTMNWNLFFLGAGLAIALMLGDKVLERRKSALRLHVLGVAVSIYMPLSIIATLFVGAFISYLTEKKNANSQRYGVLLSAGLITGESLCGLMLSIPFAMTQSTEIFLWNPLPSGLGLMIGMGLFALICRWLYQVSLHSSDKA